MSKALSLLRQTFASLGYRDFRLVWSATLVHHIGEWLEMVGLLWFVQDLTGSVFVVSLVFFLRVVPMAFFSFVGGVVADRMSRRNLLILSKLGAALLSIALAGVVFFEVVALWHIIVLSILSGVATSFNQPARQSLVPNLVKREHLMNAITLDSGSMMATRILGGPLVGFLLSHWGVTAIFGLRALGAFIAVGLLIFLPPYRPSRNSLHATPWQDIKGAASYLSRERVILWLVAINILPMVTTLSFMGLLPAFTRQVLHAGEWEYGWLQMAPGIGSALSVLVLGSLSGMRHKGLLIFLFIIVEGLALLLFATSRWFLVSLPLLALVGAMNNAFMTTNATLIQSSIPDEMRGRVMSLREAIRGIGPVGSLLAGALAALAGPLLALAIVGGTVAVLPAALLFRLTKIRKLM